MDSRLPKFCRRILVSSIVVFIFLSVPTTGEEEATRCYWCGPLADQVHRSQRAPSCDSFDLDHHRTVCDKGYTHCATVATSPPYAESRLCVKFYQDECYSLYCNSTKTWRMVCACRGDLCNGRLTDRETKAFAAVPRDLGTSRPKRTLISGFNSVKTKTPADNNTIIIINNTTGYDVAININLQGDQPSELTENASTAHTMDHTKHFEDNIIIEHGTIMNMESSITHAYVSKVEPNYNKVYSTPPIMPATATDAKLDDAEIDRPTTPIIEYSTFAEISKAIGSDVTSMKPTSIEVEVTVVANATPPLKLPPAEALQQNVTPAKATDLTTVPTPMTTENNQLIETTTRSNKMNNISKENVGAQNIAYLIIFLITFLIHYCL